MRCNPLNWCRKRVAKGFFVVFSPLLFLANSAFAQTPPAKIVGTVKSTAASSVVLRTDAGADTTVTFADSARIVRATPGKSDLKAATPIQISDIQVGDRIAARGQ